MSAADYQWKLEPHVCSACLGRVVSRLVGGKRECRCTNCAATWPGEVKVGCACGMRVGNKDAGIRCVVNEDRRPELLSEIVAKEVA